MEHSPRVLSSTFYLNTLVAVAAISSDDVWAVGQQRYTEMEGETLTLHWDGSTWTVVPSPNPDGNIYSYFVGMTSHRLG